MNEGKASEIFKKENFSKIDEGVRGVSRSHVKTKNETFKKLKSDMTKSDFSSRSSGVQTALLQRPDFVENLGESRELSPVAR